MTNDVFVHLISFGTGKVKEAVTENEDGSYSIFIEESLSKSEQIAEYEHAMRHITMGHFERDIDADVAEVEAHNDDRKEEKWKLSNKTNG